ncbi:MAG: tRNA epoxyqueuosine(34) reductase QueG [Bacteroidales bacterium]|nr:tRNA epoxyqueuosine(34) reductase QueG [Bacteroidales bacterium]
MRIPAERIKALALQNGFDACGISSIDINDDVKEFVTNWITSGYDAEMRWYETSLNTRFNPENLFPKANSIISVIINYNHFHNQNSKHKISQYAHGKDYHLVVKSQLQSLIKDICAEFPKFEAISFCDTSPVLERYFAAKSGLGFIGKNSCLINEELGSKIFIGGLICNAETDFDNPIIQNCGDCDICLRSCPTQALSSTGLNANKCISYHTIENKGDIPENIAKKITNQLFGCDICQDVCPYNKTAPVATCNEFNLIDKIGSINYDGISQMSNREFARQFAETSLLRAGRKKILSNYAVLITRSTH